MLKAGDMIDTALKWDGFQQHWELVGPEVKLKLVKGIRATTDMYNEAAFDASEFAEVQEYLNEYEEEKETRILEGETDEQWLKEIDEFIDAGINYGPEETPGQTFAVDPEFKTPQAILDRRQGRELDPFADDEEVVETKINLPEVVEEDPWEIMHELDAGDDILGGDPPEEFGLDTLEELSFEDSKVFDDIHGGFNDPGGLGKRLGLQEYKDWQEPYQPDPTAERFAIGEFEEARTMFDPGPWPRGGWCSRR